jgi:FkbM family methyltransferase
MNIKKLNLPKQIKDLPVDGFRDLINLIRQDLKFKYLPFKLYYRYRSKKYAKRISPELNLIKFLANKNKISIDIGANLGLFTFYLQKYSKYVYAFEPNPYPLRNLKNLVNKNTEVIPIAIGNKDGYLDFFIPKNKKGWSSNGASLKEKEINLGIKHNVVSRKLDSLEINNVGLIKIDVEGFEKQVLEGASKTINDFKPNLIIENEWIHQKNPGELFDSIYDLDYEIFYVNSKLKLEKINQQFNILEAQKNPNQKKIGYIQNFICIHKESLSHYKSIIL